jgi:VanZ family protein
VSEPRARSFFREVGPALAYTVFIFYAGSVDVPPPPFEPPVVEPDKILHALAFGFLSWLAYRAVRFELPALGVRKQALYGALVACLVGGLLELYQAALPNRTADFVDFLADALGAFGAMWLVVRFDRLRGAQETVSRAASSSRTNE